MALFISEGEALPPQGAAAAPLRSRRPEPEVMDIPAEARAYAETDFSQVNQAFVGRLLELCGGTAKASEGEPLAPQGAPGAPLRTALDLGTGPGDIPVRILRARPGWRVVAVDASRPMLGFAQRIVERARLGGSIALITADAKRLPLPSRAFDVIFSNSLLHHLSDPEMLWAEIMRVGKPQAVVLLRDLARPATAEAAREIVKRYAGDASKLLQEEYYRSLLSAFTPEEVRSQLAQACLGVLKVATVSDRHLDVFGRFP